jgi:hypothetical protein
MTDDVCVASKYGDSEICDIEDSRSAAREEDGVGFLQKLESKDVFGKIFSRTSRGTCPEHIIVSLIYGEKPLTCPECEEG